MPQHKRCGKREVERRQETANLGKSQRSMISDDEQIVLLSHRPGSSAREIARLTER